MKIRSYALADRRFDNWQSEVSGRWTYRRLYEDVTYRNEWTSFDCLAWDAREELVYAGLTLLSGDILQVFDPAAGTFSSAGFGAVVDRFDAKLHRSLEWDVDGSLWAATALLHDADDQAQAAGGKIVRWRPGAGRPEVVTTPVEHQYIQQIKLDPNRRVIYGFTYPAEYFFRYDIDANATRVLAYIGNSVMICQPHGAVIDNEGGVWGTWGESRAFEDSPGEAPLKLFRYDPKGDEMEYFGHGLPRVSPGDRGSVDHMVLSRGGDIFVGTGAGALARVDARTGEVHYIGKPFPGPRLAGLVEGEDGYLYFAGNAGFTHGGDGTARFGRCEVGTGRLEDLGPIRDETRVVTAAKVHMMIETVAGRFYCGENDHIFRSSYLWELETA